MRAVTMLGTMLLVFCFAVASASPSCVGVPTTGPNVVTWTGKCTDLQSPGTDCWTPQAPTSTSTAILNSGARATLSPPVVPSFTLFSVTNLIVESGAELYVTAGAIQASNCMLVNGELILNSTGSTNVLWPTNSNVSQTPTTAYLPDPAQPEGTDCSVVPTGFTPRVCGPGALSLSGNLIVTGIYSSLFMSGTIEATGALTISNYGFMWGNITNRGSYSTAGYYTYQHGFLYNYGVANISVVAFDVWATAFVPNRSPLLIENHNALHFISAYLAPTNTWQGTYRAVLINYGNADFSDYSTQSNWDFDVFNYGSLSWNGWMQFYGLGTFVNKGVFTVNSASAFLSTFHSLGGTINLINGGTLNYGSSTTSASATMKLCQLTQGMPSDLKERFEKKSKERQLAARHLGHNEPVIEQRGDCWWYGDFCYHSPYIWSPPVNVDEAMNVERPAAKHASGVHVDRHGGSVRLRVQQLIADSELSADTPCAVRYSLDDTIITGDGSGSVMANLPVRVTKKLELRAGAKWYVAAERRGAPFYGGGRVVVRRGAKLFAGISADFKHDGTLEVQRGGQLAIPRHASVFVSNHTLLLQPGAQLHVDGKLTIAEAKEGRVSVDQCGQLNGVGEVVMEREGMLGCHTDSRKKKLHHDTLDQHEKKHGAARRH